MTLRHRLLPSIRRKQLRELLASKPGLRIIETHNGLSGVVGTTAVVEDAAGNSVEFDGLWVSSLTDSAAKAHPDTEVIDTSSRLLTIQEILQVTNKPIIVDGDTGGEPTQFEYFCSKLENLGVSAVVIEDKQHPKRNSLEADVAHILEDPHVFATKINRAKAICLSDDFMIITRIESFIAGEGLEDAIYRAEIYLDSQADGILIHSSQKTPEQVYAFMEAYQQLCARKGIYKPVLCVPTTYHQVTDEELFEKGFNIVIYANHLLRAAHKAMRDVTRSILTHKRSYEASDTIASVKDIMEEVGFFDVKIKDAKHKKNPTPVILLGSGRPMRFVDTEMQDLPIGNIAIAGKQLLEWQLETLALVGLSNVTLVSGYAREKLPALKFDEIYNADFANTNVLYSLMLSREKMDKGFIMIFGDIFFNRPMLLNYLLNTESDILLLVDNSFNLRIRKSIKPTTDLVILDSETGLRKPNVVTEKIADIGNNIPLDKATHEFIGMAKFSPSGAKQLCDAYETLKQSKSQQELRQLDFYSIIKALIATGVVVEALEINHGWSEVHSLTDIAAIEKVINRKKHSYTSTVSI